MKFGVIAGVLMTLSLVAGCALSSGSGTVYQFRDKTYVVIDSDVLEQLRASNTYTTTHRIFLVELKPDGTHETVAEKFVSNRPDRHGYAIGEYNTTISKARTLGEDPIQTIRQNGTFVRRIDSKNIKVDVDTLVVTLPTSALSGGNSERSTVPTNQTAAQVTQSADDEINRGN